MKLSKKGAAVQQAIHDALASGKALGGLLVGFAATVAGCREGYTPAHTMGRFPDSRYQENTKNENTEEFVTEGEIAVPEPTPPQPKPNVVRERLDKEIVLGGKPLSPPAPPLPPGQYHVKHGDTLTKIAKTHGTTIAELKGLNSFDDKRANSLISGEIIKVPSQPNAVNEDRSKALSVKGRFPSKK